MTVEKCTEQIFHLIPLLDKKFQRPLSLHLKPWISPLQVHVLTVLAAKKATMTELAAEIPMSKQQMTPIVDKLFAEGLVQREYDEVDRRIIRISITEPGLKMRETVKEKALDILADKLDYLERRDLERLNKTLTELHRIIDKLP